MYCGPLEILVDSFLYTMLTNFNFTLFSSYMNRLHRHYVLHFTINARHIIHDNLKNTENIHAISNRTFCHKQRHNQQCSVQQPCQRRSFLICHVRSSDLVVHMYTCGQVATRKSFHHYIG